jgi:hypothetical protein
VWQNPATLHNKRLCSQQVGNALFESGWTQIKYIALNEWSADEFSTGLDLGNRNLSIPDLIVMAGILKRNNQIGFLNLSSNSLAPAISMSDRPRLLGQRFDCAGMQSLCHTLGNDNKSVKQLGLSNCSLHAGPAVDSIIELISKNSRRLINIDLRGALKLEDVKYFK